VTSQIGWPGVLGEWTLTPVSDALVLLAAVAYLNAARRRRGWHGARWPPWRTACTLSGLAVIVLARDSAIGVYSRELHSMHMVQHLALITVAPVLLALGHPLTLALESSTHGREIVELVRHNRVVAIVTHPLVAFASYAAVIVGTHLTGFMALTFAHPWLHELELALYLLSGYLFAAPLVAREPLRRRPPYPARFGLVLLSMTVHTFVGIMLMTTGDSADLRIAGGLMWFVGDGLMMAVALVIAGHWVTDPNRSRGETARTLHHRVLTALTRPRPPHRPKDEGDP
jgi:putative membrane protein